MNLDTGSIDVSKNNGQLGRIESFIGTQKQSQQRFGYDSIGRLSEAKEYRGDNNSLTYKQKFDFDRFGNLYRKVSQNPTAGQANPLPFTPIEETDISKANNKFTTGTTYDDSGAVISDNKFRQMNFAYDANGRMVKAMKASTPDAFSVYDASGNRVAEKVNDVWRFSVYDIGGKVIAEYGGLTPSDEGGVKYLLTDWQGSTRAIVSNSGFVQARMDYQAFGEEISAGVGMRTTAQGFGANQDLKDRYALTRNDEATGLNHTPWRKQEQKAGRWTSPDPYKGSLNAGNPQSFNRYCHVKNDPINFIDPSGLLTIIQRCDFREEGHFLVEHCEIVAVFGDHNSGGGEITPISVGGGGGSPPVPPKQSCTLNVFISGVGSSGSSNSSSSSSGSSSGGSSNVGVFNHLYVTFTDSSTGRTIGVRAGPGTDPTLSNGYSFGNISAEYREYDKTFVDYEESPTLAVEEVFDESCEKLNKSFLDTVNKTNNSNIPYTLSSKNSNAFVYTLLTKSGIEANSFDERLNKKLGKIGSIPGWGTILPLK